MFTNHLEVTMFRSVTPLLLVLALVGAACTDAPTALPSADAAGVSEARVATNPPGQVREIEALLSSWEAAWAAHDAAAYAAHYAEDVDFVNPLGGILSGREAIREQHEFLFSGPFRGSTNVYEIRRLVFLTGTIAIVDLNMRLTGFAFLPPGLPQFEPGLVFTRARMVVMKQRGTWEIIAQQLTPVLPPPPAP
jgi:uncharacterized protein (TIGR02246 family)